MIAVLVAAAVARADGPVQIRIRVLSPTDATGQALAAALGPTRGTTGASPNGEGLPRAPSWFWLDPAPTAKQAPIPLAGQPVPVVATPVVAWAFGDGATLTTAGAGTPYTSG